MAKSAWYAVKVDVPRTGRAIIEYVIADSKQAAGETDPGSTVLGGPYNTQSAAMAAFPQGSHGTTKSSTGPPVVNVKPLSYNWLTGIGGDIASGIEGGVVQLLKDVWTVIEGPLLVIVGAVVFLFVIVSYFKSDIAAGATALVGAAA
jgi:hypothetical protein